MAIPALNNHGELPPGEYDATLDEIETRFGNANRRRRILMQGLRTATVNLAQAGIRKIWIDGSFVTNKNTPNDIDGVWETHVQIDLSVLDSIFLGKRSTMKEKYGLDFFPDVVETGIGLPFPAFFQINREGEPKGILIVRLGE